MFLTQISTQLSTIIIRIGTCALSLFFMNYCNNLNLKRD